MKYKVNYWLLFVALLSTFTFSSCSDPDEDEDDIYVNIIGGSSDGKGEEDSKVSIVGSWKRVFNANSFTYSDVFTFNQNGSGTLAKSYPQWDEDGKYIGNVTDTFPFTYQYEMDLGVLKIINMTIYDFDVFDFEGSAFIISNDDVDVLHLLYDSGDDFDLSFSGVYRNVQ